MRTIKGPEIQTASGRGFNVFDPSRDDIHIHDIARALSNQCRFGGHVRQFYSVAQHSVLASEVVRAHVPDVDEASYRDLCKTMLMHDAAEAYVVDIPRPIKHRLSVEYLEIEDRVMRALADRFGFDWPLPIVGKEIDNRLLFTEKRDLLAPANWSWSVEPEPFPNKIVPLTPVQSFDVFMRRFTMLFGEGYV